MSAHPFALVLSLPLVLACTSPSDTAKTRESPPPKDDRVTERSPPTEDDGSTSTAKRRPPLPECGSLEDIAVERAKQSGDYVDCGVANREDPEERWKAVYDCVKQNHKNQAAFSAVFHLRGIDSEVGSAFVGVAGPEYRVEQIHWDSDPSGGSKVGSMAAIVSPCVLELPTDCAPSLQAGPCMLCGDGSSAHRRLCKTEEAD